MCVCMCMCVCVCVCVCVRVCVCLSDRRRPQSLNQSTDLVQIRYVGSSCKYLEPFLVFLVPLDVEDFTFKRH